MKRSFASDNNAGVHPRILEALQQANVGHEIGYGDDPYTRSAITTFKKHLGVEAEIFFVFGGTGANVAGLSTISQSFHSIICAETAHINVDECGAPEKFSGSKLIAIPTPDGKLTPDMIRSHLHGFGFEHHSQPKVISITQSSEMGTVYSINEIKALRALADEFDLFLHMDGARICNAAAALDCSLADITGKAGVDVLSFGGNKNGLMFGEAVVFFNPGLARNFKYIRKQSMQLYSKMRFVSTQFDVFLKEGLWLENAKHANAMARYLADKLQGIKQVRITQPVQVNAVFAEIPKDKIAALQKEFFFYVWNEQTGEVRWMTAFDTTKEDVDGFVEAVKKVLKC